jgi:hypothetical protein
VRASPQGCVPVTPVVHVRHRLGVRASPQGWAARGSGATIDTPEGCSIVTSGQPRVAAGPGTRVGEAGVCDRHPRDQRGKRGERWSHVGRWSDARVCDRHHLTSIGGMGRMPAPGAAHGDHQRHGRVSERHSPSESGSTPRGVYRRTRGGSKGARASPVGSTRENRSPACGGADSGVRASLEGASRAGETQRL